MLAFLQNAVFYVVPFLLVITVIVTIHELGHFWTARLFGVAVDRFSIGFGPRIVGWRDRAGVEWRISWLPFGGYVKFAGDENAASLPDQHDLDELRASIIANEGPGAEKKYLHFKPLWQRALIVAAGPAANFLLAIVLLSIILGAFGEPVTSTRISGVLAGSPAQRAGLQVGDRIVGVDGRKITSFEDMSFYVQLRNGVPLDITVNRGGRLVSVTATPGDFSSDSPFGGKQTSGRLGIEARGTTLKHYGPLEAIGGGARRTWQITEATVYSLSRIVTGHVDLRQLHSFVGIAKASGSISKDAAAQAQTAQVNPLVALAFVLLQIAGSLSVSVGLLNLLPIPVLDGGHLLFYAYESVSRRPVSARVQAAGYRVGLALLLCLMLFATWNDLSRLRVFHFFGGLFS